MPRLWQATIDAHRREVRDAILETTARLVAEHGLRAVTMSRIADETGIGRATLYKYFPSVEAILRAWHARQIGRHLEQLAALRDQAAEPLARLEAVLAGYARILYESRRGHDDALAALLHRDEQVAAAEHRLRAMIGDLLVAAADAGDVRDDVPPDELAAYSLHALPAAGRLPSKEAVERLVGLVLTGLRGRA
ncbi:MAG: TetR/AcrR family transcriptional regulator [Thermoleophilia bacterium]|nr:TetR/AcrR family transcriptional regulator [Thermoleophilia bacterium]